MLIITIELKQVSFAKILEFASQWSSVLGFILGIVTVLLAGTIKKAVSGAERKAFFNLLAEGNLKKLKEINRNYIQSIDGKNRQVLLTKLSDMKTVISILLRSVPDEFRPKGKKAVKQIKSVYKSYFYWEEKKWYEFFLKKKSKDDMLDVYNRVNDFIDHLDNCIKEISIVR